ncbi:tyrosine-type recombinase/integrase [Micromonospora purpureochromogenes]|uniref:tyrosine-type recombinase/integrase n=1 Tax=Micromonospora purpureochromogenes TaxID=47872 RepID=UPI003F4CD715
MIEERERLLPPLFLPPDVTPDWATSRRIRRLCLQGDSGSGQRAPWRRARPVAGRLEDVQKLRHTAATLLLAQGVPARVLMELLGHSQIGVTMNIYSHVMPTQLVQAADAMENVLWGEGQ